MTRRRSYLPRGPNDYYVDPDGVMWKRLGDAKQLAGMKQARDALADSLAMGLLPEDAPGEHLPNVDQLALRRERNQACE